MLKRLCSSLAAALLTSSAAVLPAVHSWRVDSAEAAYHSGEARPAGDALAGRRDAGHHHHTDADCPLCVSLARGRALAATAAARPAAPGASAALALRSAVLLPSREDASASPRGPPAQA